MSRGRAELLIPSSFTSCMEYLKNIGSSLRLLPMFLHLFGGDHVIIHRLSAGQQVDLGGGTRLREDIRGLLGLLLRHILAIEDGDEAGILCSGAWASRVSRVSRS